MCNTTDCTSSSIFNIPPQRTIYMLLCAYISFLVGGVWMPVGLQCARTRLLFSFCWSGTGWGSERSPHVERTPNVQHTMDKTPNAPYTLCTRMPHRVFIFYMLRCVYPSDWALSSQAAYPSQCIYIGIVGIYVFMVYVEMAPLRSAARPRNIKSVGLGWLGSSARAPPALDGQEWFLLLL